jgi:hypothetical protein
LLTPCTLNVLILTVLDPRLLFPQRLEFDESSATEMSFLQSPNRDSSITNADVGVSAEDWDQIGLVNDIREDILMMRGHMGART